MKARKLFGVATAVVFLSGAASAGQFQDGVIAAKAHDYSTAMTDWQPLAKAGDTRAQTMLGFMYLLGWGVPVNLVESYMWFALGAVGGSPEAAHYRDKVASQMTQAQIAKAQHWADQFKATP